MLAEETRWLEENYGHLGELTKARFVNFRLEGRNIFVSTNQYDDLHSHNTESEPKKIGLLPENLFRVSINLLNQHNGEAGWVKYIADETGIEALNKVITEHGNIAEKYNDVAAKLIKLIGSKNIHGYENIPMIKALAVRVEK